jgi:nitroimidazol reductase NimA-like FMN-containing flavoprotein (pyridoxamine 5'-phosphate oxidase superfamily)
MDFPNRPAVSAGHQHAAIVRSVIDHNCYMTLSTADERGQPWASPVWYAIAGYREFLWVSSPGTRHSRNLAMRPEIAIVIFDSHAPIGRGQAVYMSATAGEVARSQLDRAIAIFSVRSELLGGEAWETADVLAPARLRLYRATPTEFFVLDGHDHRLRVTMAD